MPADIIILGAIAVFVLLRLRGVLGHKIGHGAPPKMPDMSSENDRVVQLATRLTQEKEAFEETDAQVIEEDVGEWDEKIERGIGAFRAIDPQFSMREFLDGAQAAFEMVLEAYNKEDRDTLKSLLSQELYESFSAEMEAHAGQEEKTDTTLVAILSAAPEAVEVRKNKGQVTVSFRSEQMQSAHDKSGKLVEGSAGTVETLEDVWTFERDLSASNPNWTIVAT